MTQGPQNPGEPIGARPVGEPARKRPAWLVPLVVLLVLAVLVLLLLSRCGGDDDDSAEGPSASASATTPAGGSSPSAASGQPETSPSAGTGAGAGGAGETGTVVAGGQVVLPLPAASGGSGAGAGELADAAGQEAVAQAVRVQSVPADEGFWLGTSETDRVWVQLTGAAGESPYKVGEGDDVSFTGEVTENAAGFAEKAGLTAAEGAAMLTEQGHHISVPRSELRRS